MMTQAMLHVHDLHAWYGKSHVLQGVDFHVGDGEIVSLIGRNGVGRSTTCKAIMGLVTATGSIHFRGRELSGLATHRIARHGLGYVPEDRQIFAGLTTHQNLRMGRRQTAPGGRWGIDDAYRLFPGLQERAAVRAELLSGGEQQMLSMCRTLMGTPQLVIIDEPTEGLAPQVVAQVENFLLQLAAGGISVLLVEQKLTIAMRMSQRVYVMGHGQIVYEGTPVELQSATHLRRRWLDV